MRIDGALLPNGRSDAMAAPLPVEGVAGPAGGLWGLYVTTWVVLVAASALGYRLGVPWQLIVIIMAPLTLVGIVWKPIFGVCLMGTILPIGQAIILPGTVTAERGIGLLFGLGAAINILLTRKGLRFANPIGLALFAISLLGLLSTVWAVYPEIAALRSWTVAQLFIYAVLIMSVCPTTDDLRWPLRVYVVACIASFLIAILFGFRMSEQARLSFTVGEERMNPNSQAMIYVLALFSALYLYRKDPIAWLRLLYVAAMAILPIAVLWSGARKATVFFLLILAGTLLFSKGALRRPAPFLGAVVLLALLGVVLSLAYVYVLPETVGARFTAPEQYTQSIQHRFRLIASGFDNLQRRPLGSGMGCYFEPEFGHAVHNDLFYLLANLGLPGAAVFAAFVLAIIRLVWRMPPSTERWCARSIVAFLLLLGLGGTYLFHKSYWLFMAFAWIAAVHPSAASKGEAPGFGAPLQHAPPAGEL